MPFSMPRASFLLTTSLSVDHRLLATSHTPARTVPTAQLPSQRPPMHLCLDIPTRHSLHCISSNIRPLIYPPCCELEPSTQVIIYPSLPRILPCTSLALAPLHPPPSSRPACSIPRLPRRTRRKHQLLTAVTPHHTCTIFTLRYPKKPTSPTLMSITSLVAKSSTGTRSSTSSAEAHTAR